ncbi:MAG: hypothetical protein V1853_05055 [bacterium]
MVDINLLKDTKNDEKTDKKAGEPLAPKLTDPKKVEPAPKEPKLPSRFAVWLKSLRGKKKIDEIEKEIEQKPKSIKPPPIPKFEQNKSPNPEDIFAGLDKQKLYPDNTPPLPHMSDTPMLGKEPSKPKLTKQAPPAIPDFSINKPKKSPEPKLEKKDTPPLPPLTSKPAKSDKPTDRSFLVNLLPTDFKQSINPKSKLISLGITLFATIFVIGGAYALLTIYRTSIIEDIQNLRTERSGIEDQIQNLKPKQKEAIAVNSRLQIITGLLDQHIYWTKFFSKLEDYTIDDVYYTGAFSGSLSGQITLSALGGSFTSPARQLLLLEQADDFVTNVSINSATASDVTDVNLPPGSVVARQVAFTISATLVPDIYYYDEASYPRGRFEPEIYNLTFPQNTGSNTNSSTNLNTNASTNANRSGNLNTNSSVLNTNQSNPNTNSSTVTNTNPNP